MRVESSGFKTLVRPNVVLRVNQATALDFMLEVGSVSTTVEVKGQAPLLNAASASLSQDIDNKFIAEMPVLDRQVLNLAFLVPGVVETSDGICGPGLGCTGMNFFSNGQRNSSADVRLDGTLVSPAQGGQGSGQNNITYSPSPEAIQEFNIQNNGLSAEYGLNGGTVVNFVTKSGTNTFHGSGYGFDRRPFGAAK